MARETHSILLSVGFLHRRIYRKIAREEMSNYGLRPLDYLSDGVPFPEQPVLARASDLTMASDLMRKADGYLAVIDTQYIMKPDKTPAEAVKHEFEEAVRAGLPIGLLVVTRTNSAPKYVNERLIQSQRDFRSFYDKYSSASGGLRIIQTKPDRYQSGIRDLLGVLSSGLKRADDSDLEPDPPKLGPGSLFVATPEGYELAPRPPAQAERADTTQVALHRRLVRRVERLKGAMERVSNTHPSLAAEFGDYAVFMTADLGDLDVASLWSAGNGIHEFVRALSDQPPGLMTEPLEPEVLSELRSLTRDHTAFVMGFAEGQVLTARAQALHDVGRPPGEIAATANAVLRAMLTSPRLLAERAQHLVRSLTRAFEDLPYQAIPLATSGYETGKNGLIAMGRTLHPLFLLSVATDAARILAGDAQADTLRTTLTYLHENSNIILAFAGSDPQLTEWLIWLTARAQQFLNELGDGLLSAPRSPGSRT